MNIEALLPITLWVMAIVVVLIVLRTANVLRYIPNNQVGIVEKLWTTKGSIKSGFIALNGEAGFEPEVLRGGLHVFFPFMYRIHKSDLVTVGQGKIAYVFARDGAPLGASQVLGANDTEDKSDFQDVRKFLLGGGQKGPQRKILREGTYAINTTQFAIITDERVYGHALSSQERVILDSMEQTLAARSGFEPIVLAAEHDLVGIVTVHDGPSLPPGEIIAPEVGTDLRNAETFHNNFQEPEKFLAAGGYRGRQLQVIVEGTWYLNRLFSTVDRCRSPSFPSVTSASSSSTPARAPATYRASNTVTVSSSPMAAVACGRIRCCPASTLSIPLRARWRSFRPSTSSSNGCAARSAR